MKDSTPACSIARGQVGGDDKAVFEPTRNTAGSVVASYSMWNGVWGDLHLRSCFD